MKALGIMIIKQVLVWVPMRSALYCTTILKKLYIHVLLYSDVRKKVTIFVAIKKVIIILSIEVLPGSKNPI